MKVNAEKFVEFMEKKGINHEREMAEILDISESMVYRILNGENAGSKIIENFAVTFPKANLREFFVFEFNDAGKTKRVNEDDNRKVQRIIEARMEREMRRKGLSDK